MAAISPRTVRWILWVTAGIAVACGGDNRSEQTTSTVTLGSASASASASATATATDSATGGTDDSASGVTGGVKLDVGDETEGMVDDTGSCAAVEEHAMNEMQPADIVFVLDNSGSMDLERGFLEDVLNDFSNQISNSGIDHHVVIISTYPDSGVCIDPPLGGGGCPTSDDNPPIYQHVVENVGSTEQWTDLVNTYPQWEAMIRPEAQLHIVAVTDDEDDLSAVEFQTMFNALDPNKTPGYIFHAISPSVNGITCVFENAACCAVIGDFQFDHQAYIDHVQDTGGVYGDLCELQAGFQPVFDELTMNVISNSSLSCGWDIPPPPEGMSFNPDEVNVEFDDGMGGILQIGRVDDPSECANVTDGWYYDDPMNPTRIEVCPQTCDKIQGFAMASISILFGCATIPAG